MAGAAPHIDAKVKSRVKDRLRRGDTAAQIVNTMNVNSSFIKRVKAEMRKESAANQSKEA